MCHANLHPAAHDALPTPTPTKRRRDPSLLDAEEIADYQARARRLLDAAAPIAHAYATQTRLAEADLRRVRECKAAAPAGSRTVIQSSYGEQGNETGMGERAQCALCLRLGVLW